MPITQYTIRGVPTEVDSRLRRLARLKGQSLNQVVLDKLSSADSARKAVQPSKNRKFNTDFDDLFGTMTPLEPKVEKALKAQRYLS